jgi:SagB-type dehydrogenase family enzyme
VNRACLGRVFTGHPPVNAVQVSQLLWRTQAPLHLTDAGELGWVPRRAYANGGARSELETYLMTRGVDGLADGLYHYQSAGHYLSRIGPALSGESLRELCLQQDMCAAAPVTVFVTASPGRSSAKYRTPRALRVIHHDAGCLAQVWAMTATCLGLGAYITAAFLDTAAEQLLGADGVREIVLLILGAGRPAPCAETIVPLDPAMIQAAGLWDNE